MAPLAIDLFCGLGGWTEGLLAEGYDVVGFDMEQHIYGEHRYPAQLVIQDVLTLHGAQFKDAALIVASPRCQEYSYMAMPWTKAKAKAKAIRADATGEAMENLNRLFNVCFRIQREACEAAARHVPMVVENVLGAQPWVGRSRWNFGSFALWGDVPALMPIRARGTPTKIPPEISKSIRQGQSPARWTNPAEHYFGKIPAEGFKSSGMNWSDPARRGQDFTRIAGKQAEEGRKAFPGGADGWFGDYATMVDGIKQHGSGRERFAGDGKISRMTSSNSAARKAASAMIAKIPLPLSQHIAMTFRL
jgi:hypothetical protein